MAKTQEELDMLQSRLKELYHGAVVSGICDSQKSFAELIGTAKRSRLDTWIKKRDQLSRDAANRAVLDIVFLKA